MKSKIAIIGTGNVGNALRRGLEGSGYEVKAVGKDPGRVRETAAWGQIVILAVPYPAVDEALQEMGDSIQGKPLVDVTNALTSDFQLAIGCTTSGAEELQKKASGAKVVKAFNTVFAEHMATGMVKGTQLTVLVSSDDQGAKEHIMGVGRDLGFDAVDAGPLKHARWLETLGYLNIQLGYTLKMGTQMGFKLIH
jgi:8-hydroxy-5-deazaflavin:NADPH oxidoreductase